MNPNVAALRDEHVKLAFNEYVKGRGKDYTIVRKMTSNGAFSSVYEVRDGNGSIMVMKAVDTAILDVNIDPNQVIEYTNKEISSMKLCADSPYVMDLIDAADVTLDGANGEHVFLLFMPKLQVSTEFFRNTGYQLSDILSMAKDICRALDFCHSKKILHRDVKPENIYYSIEKNHFVLSDFGICRSLFDHDHAVTRIGSLLAPEIFLSQELKGRFNSDVYSLGMTVLLLNAEMAPSEKVIADRFNNLNSNVKFVISKAIKSDPSERYQTAAEFLQGIEDAEAKYKVSQSYALNVKRCYDAILNKDEELARRIAEEGHNSGIPVMSCLYAYILASKRKVSEALSALSPLVNKGDEVAVGLFGIIGRIETANSDFASDQKMVAMIFDSANNGFAPAQYYVGRWFIDGQSGLPVDVERGVAYIFESIQRGFLPAMYYFKKSLMRNSEKFTSIQSMVDLMNIALEGFSKEDYPEEMIRAIINAY